MGETASLSTDSGAGSLKSQSNNSIDPSEIMEIDEEKLINAISSKQDKNILEFIKKKLPQAKLIGNLGTEMIFTISNKKEDTKYYQSFFSQIESNLNNLGISSMGISDTTLEEIFIKLAKEPSSVSFKSRNYRFFGIDLSKVFCKVKEPEEMTPEKIDLYSSYTKERVNSHLLWIFMQFYALLIKRFHRVSRNLKGFFAEIVLPVIFVCLALLVATLVPATTNRPALELHPWYYSTPNRIFISESSSLDFDRPFFINSKYQSQVNLTQQPNYASVKKITNALYDSPGLGARCMNNYSIVVSFQSEDRTRSNAGSVLACESYSSLMIQNYTFPTEPALGQFYQTNFTYTKKTLDCNCDPGFPKCPDCAGGDIDFRPIYGLKSEDILYDLTSRNVSDWIIKTEFTDKFFQKRYGGYEFLTNSILNTSMTLQSIYTNLNQFIATGTSLLSQSGIMTGISNPNSNSFRGTNPILASQNVKLWYNLKGKYY